MDGKMVWPVVVMNFTGAYDYGIFAHNPEVGHIDCTHLTGTDCYCDPDAASALVSLIGGYPAEGIHFIDSGNHHYMTRFWTDKLDYPFSLALFDHHTDMQPPAFSGLLSCGGWVRDMLDNNRFLDKVIVIGVSDSLASNVAGDYGDRVRFFCESRLGDEDSWRAFAGEHVDGPVYISVDKDVLGTDAARTDWDQGSMTMSQLKRALSVIFRNEHVAGADICGELPAGSNILCGADAWINDRTNAELVRLLESEACRQTMRL